MKHPPHYVPGDNYILDDLSGFKIRASEARMIPGGQTGNLIVAPSRWEPQHPQDFVRGVPDEQAANIVRPRQPNQFVITGTYVTAFSAAQSYTITVDSTVGFINGDTLQIMLDTGVNFYAKQTGVSGYVLTFTPPLPATVGGNYGDPIENTVLNLGPNSTFP